MDPKIFDLVTQRPNPELKVDNLLCPYGCEGAAFKEIVHMETMVGCSPKGDRDLNHHWISYQCQTCMKVFCKEHRAGNVWYTKKGKVLLGFPDCFEDYTYTCRRCDGEVVRNYTDLSGKAVPKYLTSQRIDGMMVKLYRTFYSCRQCKEKVELKEDF